MHSVESIFRGSRKNRQNKKYIIRDDTKYIGISGDDGAQGSG